MKDSSVLGVTIAGVVFVVNDLLHGPAPTHSEGFQLDLHHGHTVDELDDIKTLVAVVGIDAELVDDFKRVFAPVLKVDQGVIQRCAVIAGEAVALAKGLGGGEDIRGDDFVKKINCSSIWRSSDIAILRMIEGYELVAGTALADVSLVHKFYCVTMTETRWVRCTTLH